MTDEIKNISKNIYNEIVSLALREESLLKRLEKGIFSIPELAFTYEVGKSLVLNQERIFGSKGWQFDREIKIDSNGPTDLILTNNSFDKKILIEFKIKYTYEAYINDIEKLKSYSPDKYLKYFCALIDAFYDKNINDERIKKLNELYNQNFIWKPKNFEFFTTLNYYKKQNVCVVGFWQIN